MKRRITRLPVLKLALVAVSVLVGAALVPVAAQTAASLEGQVTVRSDGAVYLIARGQRHWVPTAIISDDELNAYPEAEPIFAALAGIGGGTTPASKPSAPASGGSGSTGSPGAGSTPAPAGPTATPDPNAQVAPTGGSCPATHAVKGATTNGVKTYYEPDRASYASITPEICFTAGSYARDAGYKSSKK